MSDERRRIGSRFLSASGARFSASDPMLMTRLCIQKMCRCSWGEGGSRRGRLQLTVGAALQFGGVTRVKVPLGSDTKKSYYVTMYINNRYMVQQQGGELGTTHKSIWETQAHMQHQMHSYAPSKYGRITLDNLDPLLSHCQDRSTYERR